MAPSADGGFLIADTGNNVVRRIAADGTITRVAGIGIFGHTGDGGPATAARLRSPSCVRELASGTVLIQEDGAVRQLSPSGRISTVTGDAACQPAVLPNGDQLYPGALLDDPDPTDSLAPNGNVIYRVASGGTRTPVAGTGECLARGWDRPSPALEVPLALPLGVAALADGGFLIADTGNDLVRVVSPTGIMTTVAGSNPPPRCGALTSYDPPNYLTVRQPLRGRARRPVTLRVTSTNAGRLTITVTRRGKRLYRDRVRAREGEFRVRLRVRLARGRYRVSLVNRGTRRATLGERRRFRKQTAARLRITR